MRTGMFVSKNMLVFQVTIGLVGLTNWKSKERKSYASSRLDRGPVTLRVVFLKLV